MFKRKSQKQPKKPDQRAQAEQLGRMLQNIYESGYIDRNTMYKMSFLKGVAGGLGSVVGATVVIALLLWVLSFFDSTPLRPVINNLQQTLESKNQQQ